MEELLLEHRGYTCVAKKYANGRWGFGKGPTPEERDPDSPFDFFWFADTEEEARKWFAIHINHMIERIEYRNKISEWKATHDYKSVAAVFNILPEVFRKRIESDEFDKSLLDGVTGSDYVVPLYYVTKAYDVLLKGTLGNQAFMIGPEEDDDCTEEEIQEFLKEEGATRSRGEAIKDNDIMKQIWKDKFDIDIDALDVYFRQFDMHIPPNVTDRQFYDYFGDAEDGVNEWVIGGINYADKDFITHECVSALMEYTAEILKYERPVGDYKLEL